MPTGSLLVDLAGCQLSAAERRLLARPGVAGVILFARNCRDRDQVAHLVCAIREVRPDLLIAVDQEGGRVQRLVEGFTRLPPMARLGGLLAAGAPDATTLLFEVGWLMAAEVLAVGLDLSFAPVLDVDRGVSAVIGDRAFGSDPQLVAEAAAAFVAGMTAAGMAATGKHFPGHGWVAADSHRELPVDPRPLAEIAARDLVPFRLLAPRLAAVMAAHVHYPAVDERPAGFSRRWLQEILRGELGFSGVVVSDDLTMAGAAVAGGVVARAAAALDAGCELLLVCNDQAAAEAVLDALEERLAASSPRLDRLRPARRPSAEALAARRREVVERLRQWEARGWNC